MLESDRDYTVELELDDPDDLPAIARKLAEQVGARPNTLPPIEVRKRSIDARRGRIRFHYVVGVTEPSPALGGAPLRETSGEPVVIVGAPAEAPDTDADERSDAADASPRRDEDIN